MKRINRLGAAFLFLLSVWLSCTAYATTPTVDPTVPGQNSPLSSAAMRAQFQKIYNDLVTAFNGAISAITGDMTGSVSNGTINLALANTATARTNIGLGSTSNVTFGAITATGVATVNLNSSALPAAQTGTVMQKGNANAVITRDELDAFGAAAHFSGVRWDGTNASPTTLQAADEIVSLNAWGFNGTAVAGARGAFSLFANQNWTTGANGTYAAVYTTPNGSTTPAIVCKFENDGGVTCPATVTGGDQGSGKINAAGLYVNGVAVATGSGGVAMIQPSSYYTTDTAGNLFPNVYSGGGGNASAHDSGWGVPASLGSDVTLELRFQMPPSIPTGTFKLVSYCMANATTGNAKYTVSDADVGAASPSAATLTGETQNTVSPTVADAYVVTKTPLTSTPVADHVSVVAVKFQTASYTLAQPMTCRFVELWE